MRRARNTRSSPLTDASYAINLARDTGPRLMAYILGYGNEMWSAGGYYFWVRFLSDSQPVAQVKRILMHSQIPMVAPFLGCLFGGFLYDVFIYTGESPVNTPYLGLKKLVHPGEAWRAYKEHGQRNKRDGVV